MQSWLVQLSCSEMMVTTMLAATKTTEWPLRCRKWRKKGIKQKGEGRNPWGCNVQGVTRFSSSENKPLALDRPAQSSLRNLLKPPKVCVCQHNEQVDELKKIIISIKPAHSKDEWLAAGLNMF